jgi:GNAT superfamily N-acetyltransferase
VGAPDVNLRTATADDASAIAPLLAELGYPTTPGEAHERLCRLLARPTACVLVAESAGHLVGLASYEVVDLLERPEPQCRVTALVTRRGHRRRGVAGALLEAIEQHARAHGCSRLEVTTWPERTDATAFYTAHGFLEQPRRLVKVLGS